MPKCILVKMNGLYETTYIKICNSLADVEKEIGKNYREYYRTDKQIGYRHKSTNETILLNFEMSAEDIISAAISKIYPNLK